MRRNFLAALVCSSLSLGSLGDALASNQQNQPLLSISRPADQMVRLDCAGAPAQPFLLQTATDIQAPVWSTVTTAIPDARGFFSCSRPCAQGETSRFFRLAQFNASGGLMARNQIRFNGGAYLDSFDSSDPALSTGGLYDPAKRRDHALAQTASQAAGAITLRTAHIYGMAATGAGGTIICGKGGVGDLAWNASQFGIQPGHATTDAGLSFQDIQVPFTSGASLPADGSFAGQNYTFVLGSGNYELPAVQLSGADAMAVTGNAVLYVTGDFATSGNGFVYIAPGASLQIFVAGSLTVSGRGIINDSQRAANCFIFGLPTCTRMTLSGTSTLYGVVDAPEAAVTFSGTADACGAFMADTIILSGSAGIHYDESLAGASSH